MLLPYALTLIQVLLDYPLAFAVLGLWLLPDKTCRGCHGWDRWAIRDAFYAGAVYYSIYAPNLDQLSTQLPTTVATCCRNW
jgi:thiamine transporter ThiT